MPFAVDLRVFDDQSLELGELRALIAEYDELYELCMTHVMTPEDQRELNNLFDCLMLKEYELWGNTGDSIMAIVNEGVPCYFPMIRHTLGILPDEDQFWNGDQ